MLSHHFSGECIVTFSLHIDMKYFTCCVCILSVYLLSMLDERFIHVFKDLNCICILYLQNVLGKTWVDVIVVV